MKKKVLPIIILSVMLCTETLFPQQVQYGEDGSIRYTTKDGKVVVVPMEGKTPFGEDIKEVSRTVRRRDFSVEVIYSSRLSDDILDGKIKELYDAMISSLERWVYDNPLPAKPMRLVISNCRFCKTGYCRRSNVRVITITAYSGETELKKTTVPHEDLSKKGAAAEAATMAVKELMPAK